MNLSSAAKFITHPQFHFMFVHIIALSFYDEKLFIIPFYPPDDDASGQTEVGLLF